MRSVVAAALAVLLAGCHVRALARPLLPPLGAEGEVHVYLEPFPRDAGRLSLAFAQVALARADGSEVPLELELTEAAGPGSSQQRRLAWGRVPAGRYAGLLIRLQRATLAAEAGPADLLLEKAPLRVDAPLELRGGRALLVALSLREGWAQTAEGLPAAAFLAVGAGPESGVVRLSGYCASAGRAGLAAFDRQAWRVSGVLTTGREPRGVAVDAAAGRAYLALSAEDQVEVLDLPSGEPLGRVGLRGGDEPVELALTPDGTRLLVLGRASSTLSFVDTAALLLLDRLALPEEPSTLLLDGGGRRAYVLSRRTGTLSVVDLANRALAGSAPTDPEPLAAQLNRAGTRLHVVHRGSAYMTTFSLPGLEVISRTHVGLGASALLVDPRTDLLYVGRGDQPRVQVYDPFALVPIDEIVLPGPVSRLALDPLNAALLAVVPSRGAVVAVDLASRKVRAVLEVGPDPWQAVVAGERN